MELSERCIQTLENEGFSSVYEESRSPAEQFILPLSEKPITVMVTEGSLLIQEGNETKELLPGDRHDGVSPVPYPATAGPAGCQYVVGEMSQ
ncbi:hypothetical protein K2Q16_00840 [Patescibacteria group bacterium]|nr:hypothetical protein [Patescibacteria group bacterium]